MPSGVGVIGAGPGVAALHLPTLARLGELFEVVHVSDAGSGAALGLAARTGAAHSTGTDELLADPRVETVAVCSPPHLHAGQVRAAVAAGKRAILCEKPLATTTADAEAVIEDCRAAGVALVVGTHHFFDPAWARAKHHLMAHGDPVRTVAITVALPPNGRYHDVVTELAPGVAPASRPRPDWGDPEVAASIVRQLVIGLAVHDLPIVRDLAPRIDRVVYARPVAPIGFAIGMVAGGVLIQLNAVMLPSGADALWRMTVGTSLDELEVDFRPAFTHDGSAQVRVRDIGGRVIAYPREAEDGYVAEWRALAAGLDGVEAIEYDELLADARYAIDLADAAADSVREAMAA